MLECPVAHIRVVVMCHCLSHITASFDERKGVLYTVFSACAGHDELIVSCNKQALVKGGDFTGFNLHVKMKSNVTGRDGL
jgi:hypothetical protein